MAQIAGRPFLEVMLRQLKRNGFKHVILAVGYRADTIREHFGGEALGLRLSYSMEELPLGTGGAVRKAAELAGSDSVLVMNGDSYTGVNLRSFVTDHHEDKAEVSVVVVPVDGRGDGGTVVVDRTGRLTHFVEKRQSSDAGYLNAGIYILSRRLLRGIADGRQVSLEREVFPRWIEEGRRIRAFVWPGKCVDIGTPERYWSAQELLGDVEAEESLPRRKG
jgi:NDP-sugar pyrophosphorylase family protein